MELLLNLSILVLIAFLLIGLGVSINVDHIMSKPRNYKK